ncbi:MAG: Mov34/MPN/PAD-1 family protein [Lachnospiraceae bacterium]
MLSITRDVLDNLYFHAQMEYPSECCGILLGKHMDGERRAYMVIPVRNMLEKEKQKTGFLLNPPDVFKAERIAEEQEMEIVGFYHSHPDYDAVVSETDRRYMLEGFSYPIISVKAGECTAVQSYEKKIQTYAGVQEKETKKQTAGAQEKETKKQTVVGAQNYKKMMHVDSVIKEKILVKENKNADNCLCVSNAKVIF